MNSRVYNPQTMGINLYSIFSTDAHVSKHGHPHKQNKKQNPTNVHDISEKYCRKKPTIEL
jgi:hypothetical protein